MISNDGRLWHDNNSIMSHSVNFVNKDTTLICDPENSLL